MEPYTPDEQVALNEKIDAIYVSVEKTRKYFVIMMWVTVIAFVLPLIGIVAIVPSLIRAYTSALGGLI